MFAMAGLVLKGDSRFRGNDSVFRNIPEPEPKL